MSATCNVKGCGKPVFANGRCREDEYAWRYVMDPEFRERQRELERQWHEQIIAEGDWAQT